MELALLTGSQQSALPVACHMPLATVSLWPVRELWLLRSALVALSSGRQDMLKRLGEYTGARSLPMLSVCLRSLYLQQVLELAVY